MPIGNVSTGKIKKSKPKNIYRLSEELYLHLFEQMNRCEKNIFAYVCPIGCVGTKTGEYVLEADYPIPPYKTKFGTIEHKPEIQGYWLYGKDVFPTNEDKLNCPFVASFDELLQVDRRFKKILIKGLIKESNDKQN